MVGRNTHSGVGGLPTGKSDGLRGKKLWWVNRWAGKKKKKGIQRGWKASF